MMKITNFFKGKKTETAYSMPEKPFNSYSYAECVEFLRNNYGFRGINNTGLSFNAENRTIDILQKECEIQHEYNLTVLV